MVNVIEEKEILTRNLSDMYSKSIISLEEYEKMIEQVSKIDSVKNLQAVQKEVYGSGDLMLPENNSEKNVTVFSWRSTTIKPVNGKAGKFVCVFGTNQIKLADLPAGKTVLHIKSIFGLTEIIIPKNVRVINKATPVLSGIFINDETDSTSDGIPELYITGTAVFGNITVVRTN